MARKRVPKKITKAIDEYLEVLRNDKLPVKEVILFGSFAKGTPHKWSDIDLCVVSPKFRNSWKATQYLWSKRLSDVDLTIEPIGFHPNDMKDKYSTLIHEIKTHGIKIPIKK